MKKWTKPTTKEKQQHVFLVRDWGASCRSVARLGSVTGAASERLANPPVEATAGKNRNTWVRHCSMTALLDTLVEHSSLTLLWHTLVGHEYMTLLQETLTWQSCGKLWLHTLVGHPDLTLLQETLTRYSCGTLLLDTLVRHLYWTLL